MAIAVTEKADQKVINISIDLIFMTEIFPKYQDEGQNDLLDLLGTGCGLSY